MKAEITKTENFAEIESIFGEISEYENMLLIKHKQFCIKIRKDKDSGNIIITTYYHVNRPCHDHDNEPDIILEIPKDGVVDCDCGKHERRDAELTIATDAGHLSLKTFFKNYVWGKKAAFKIPICCWSGKDQE